MTKSQLDESFEVRIIGNELYVHWLYSRNYRMTSWSNELAMDCQISVMRRYNTFLGLKRPKRPSL